jgi:hypothetical protein
VISFDFTKALANFQTCAADKFADRDSLSRFGLNLEQAERGLLATPHDQLISLHQNYLAGRTTHVCCYPGFSTPDRKTFRIEARVSIGPGLQTADATLDRESAQ